jgi:RND superfamily putative drug exporter
MIAALAAALLAVIAIPFLSIRLASADAGLDPAGWTAHKAYQLLARGLGAGHTGPLQLVASGSGPAQEAAFIRVEQAVARTPGRSRCDSAAVPLKPVNRTPRVALADVYPKRSPQAAATSDVLDTVRTHVIPAAERGSTMHVLVGGQTGIA